MLLIKPKYFSLCSLLFGFEIFSKLISSSVTSVVSLKEEVEKVK